ncbi:MAG: Altered inheritance of mitochondria protein 24, mitochondrial [Thelocarpon impressellum]|nr:MAG: Altered inheritance of mitochondria protein 24, mitochondrial [Thelocarpon impressellum]
MKSSTLRLQIPSFELGSWIPDSKFLRAMRESASWKALKVFYFSLRTWARRTLRGDRLFLQFHGPSTILLQSRAARLGDVLTARDVNEVAETEPGAMQPSETLQRRQQTGNDAAEAAKRRISIAPASLNVASVRRDGKVEFQAADDFKSFTGQ